MMTRLLALANLLILSYIEACYIAEESENSLAIQRIKLQRKLNSIFLNHETVWYRERNCWKGKFDKTEEYLIVWLLDTLAQTDIHYELEIIDMHPIAPVTIVPVRSITPMDQDSSSLQKTPQEEDSSIRPECKHLKDVKRVDSRIAPQKDVDHLLIDPFGRINDFIDPDEPHPTPLMVECVHGTLSTNIDTGLDSQQKHGLSLLLRKMQDILCFEGLRLGHVKWPKIFIDTKEPPNP